MIADYQNSFRLMKTDLNRNARVKLIIDTLYEGKQSLFARVVGVSEPTVSAWVSGDHGLRRSTLVKIARILHGRLNEQWLKEGKGEPNFSKNPSSLPLFEKEVQHQTPESQPIEQAAPAVKEGQKKKTKDIIRLYFQKKIEKNAADTEAAKRELAELDEIDNMEDFLGLSD